MDRDSSASLFEAIESLESSNDAKCHSTASRFEDFVFGTPLLDEARFEKVELQKQLVRHIWLAASQDVRPSGADEISGEALEHQLDLLVALEAQPDGRMAVSFPGRAPLLISQQRMDQYGSIAYSLRAILAVQQELLLTSGPPVLPLGAQAIDVLSRGIDTITLSTLLVSDRVARDQNEFEISAMRLRAAWLELVPVTADVAPAAEIASIDSSGRDGLALLEELIDRKIVAYGRYNDFDARRIQALFVTNSVRFYARTPIERTKHSRARITSTVKQSLATFASGLLAAADSAAGVAGNPLIRANDAVAAASHLLPQEMDEFEDVHLFPRLEPEERVTLEAFDCDSFRDFGMHWEALKRALRQSPPGTRLPDPFAAEILAETISQYGVLVLRIGGDIAKQGADVRLTAASLYASADLIADRARRNNDAPVRRVSRGAIVSSASSDTGALSQAFFTDMTQKSGVDFVHRSSRWLGEFRHKQIKTPPTFSGGGVAAEDVDGDSNVDLLFVGGGGNALFAGQGDGRFIEMTAVAGISPRRSDGSFGEARSPIIADMDNDGLQDILITYANDDHRLYKNLGGWKFRDVSPTTGFGGAGLIGGPATVFDFDGDGLLDVYIGYFGDYLHGAIPTHDRDNRGALRNKLFRNMGDMRFENVTAKSGTGDPGWTQAVAHVDFDRDGRQDIIVANDYGRNSFFRNLGDGRFENRAPAFGMTKPYHSMNVGISDLNADGFPDIYISNLATLVKDNKYVFPDANTQLDFDLRAMAGMLVKESDILYISNLKEGELAGYEQFRDIERGTTTTGWAWDAEFFDFDLDGDDDLYLVNGTNDYNAFSMVFDHDGADGEAPQMLLSHSRESNVFFLNQSGKLKNVSEESGADFVGNSRSSAYLDFDGDGDLDIAINNFHTPATLLRNNSETTGRSWLKIRLIGDPKLRSNRDAIGATIVVRAQGLERITRIVQGGSGYMSMDPKQQHFGLGNAVQADVSITWPNGDEERLDGLRTNRAYVIRQGSGAASVVMTAAVTTVITTGPADESGDTVRLPAP